MYRIKPLLKNLIFKYFTFWISGAQGCTTWIELIQTVSVLWLCSNSILACLFLFCLSVLKYLFADSHKIAFWGFYWSCLESIHQVGKKRTISVRQSGSPWTFVLSNIVHTKLPTVCHFHFRFPYSPSTSEISAFRHWGVTHCPPVTFFKDLFIYYFTFLLIYLFLTWKVEQERDLPFTVSLPGWPQSFPRPITGS